MNMQSQDNTPLFDALKKFIDKKVTRFHVPGHKGGRGIPELTEYIGDRAMQMDVNGMYDLDYLNNPSGVILEAERLYADAYNAHNVFFLVNGTTSGVQAMIMSSCRPGDKIILPRNAHKSAISGMVLSGAIPVYIQPEINRELGIAMGVTVESVKKAINDHPDAKVLFLVNPNYYGITSDIKSIIRLAHAHGILVLVDEAHGAHMHFHDAFPLTAMEAGADMCSASIHKTAGSLTQSSVLMLGKCAVSPEHVRKVINLTCTSSASYLLMCSLDIARKQLAVNGYDMLENTLKLARWARSEINKIDGLYAFGKELIGLPGCHDFDETKLGINIKRLGLTGYEMEYLLKDKYNIQIELSDFNNILAIISLGDIYEDLEGLINALKDISAKKECVEDNGIGFLARQPETAVTPREAFFALKKSVPLDEAQGHVCGEMVMAYPPGIPVICMGELITDEIVQYIKMLKKEKCELQGTHDPHVDYIRVLVQ